jgi:hypothetical protein
LVLLDWLYAVFTDPHCGEHPRGPATAVKVITVRFVTGAGFDRG